MANISSLTTGQLQQILAIKEKIEALQSKLESIAGSGGEVPATATAEVPKKRRMSAAGRAAIAAGARARWAKVKGKSAASKSVKKKDRRSSPAVRAKLAAAAKARWARVKAAGKTTL